MELKFLKPNIWNLGLTIILSLLYLFFAIRPLLFECALKAPTVYKAYADLFGYGQCGQTDSLIYSYVSLLVTILFVPVVYIVVSYIVNILRKRKVA